MTDSPEKETPDHTHAPPQSPAEDSVIDLRFLFIIWLKWIWIPILLGGLALYSGYKDLRAFAPQSIASIIVAPTGELQEQTSTGVSGFAAQFGIQIGTRVSSVSSFRRLRMMVGSVVLAEKLQAEHGLLQIIFSGSWDEATQNWARPSGPDFDRDQSRKAFFRQNLWIPPNLESVANYLGSVVQFEKIGGTPFQKISVSHSDPEFALWLLTTAYFGADELLREQDKLESAINQANIESKLAVETNVQFQDALRGLLVSELSREITLDEGVPFAARIIEPARISNRHTEPNLQSMLALPAAAYFGGGFLLITLIAVFRRERRA